MDPGGDIPGEILRDLPTPQVKEVADTMSCLQDDSHGLDSVHYSKFSNNDRVRFAADEGEW